MNNNLCYCLIHMVSSVFFHLVPSPLIVDLCPFLLFIRKKDISLTHHYQFKTVMLATPPKEEIKVFMSSMATAAAAKSLQSCPTLCNPIDGSPPGSTIPGILQARTLEWVTISSEVAQSCPTLSDPMDYSLPGSSPRNYDLLNLEWSSGTCFSSKHSRLF